MLVTRDVFQLLMSSLKLAQAGLQLEFVQPDTAQKTYDRSSTRDTSHVLM